MKDQIQNGSSGQYNLSNAPLGYRTQLSDDVALITSPSSLIERITDLTPNLVAVYNVQNGKYIFINKSLKPILGYETSDWLKKDIKFVLSKVHPEDLPRILKENETAIKENEKPGINKIVEFEYRIKHADGSYRWLKTYGTVFDRDEKGKILNVINISLDITAIKSSEEKLLNLTNELEKKVEERSKELSLNSKKFKALIENSTDTVVLLTSTGKLQYVSPGIKKALGFTPDEFLNLKNPAGLIHPDDRKIIYSLFKHHFSKTDGKIKTGVRVKNKQGQYRWIEVIATNLLNETSIQAIVLNFRDITTQIESDTLKTEEMRNTAMRLEIEEEFSKKGELKQTLEHCTSIIINHLQVASVRIWVIGEKNQDLNLPFPDGEKISLFASSSRKGLSENDIPIWVKIRNGLVYKDKKPTLTNDVLSTQHFKESAWFKRNNISSFAAYPLILDNCLRGVLTLLSQTEISPQTHEALRQSAYSIAQGIGRFKAELALKKSERKYHSIFSTLTEGIILQDPEGKILAANPSAHQILKGNFEDLQNKTVDKTSPAVYINEDGSNFDQTKSPFILALNSGSPQVNKIMGIIRDKKTTWISINSIPLTDEEGTTYAVASSFQDISDQKRLEKQKDEFISIASHELKTPLTTIKSYTEILKMQFRNEEKACHYLGKMNKEIDRLTALVNELLDVSKIQSGGLTLNKEDVNIEEFINSVIEDIQPSTKHKIIAKNITPKKVRLDRHRIYQVLINLLSNAIKYSPKADKVIITTQLKDNKIIFGIQDFGIGITKRDKKRIFDAFFQATTTIRQSHSGLGLGLHISKEIVTRHGGSISVYSRKGIGSIFRFSLPLNLT